MPRCPNKNTSNTIVSNGSGARVFFNGAGVHQFDHIAVKDVRVVTRSNLDEASGTSVHLTADQIDRL